MTPNETPKPVSTARELAEKIIASMGKSVTACNADRKWLESVIAEALREAVLEDRNIRTADDLYKLSYQRGRAEAYEECAKIVHKHFLHDDCAEDCVDNIEKEIRQAAKGGK